jgi:hypothetical protein
MGEKTKQQRWMANMTISYVYAISDEKSKIKIGVSGHPPSRVKQLQFECRNKLTLLHSLKCQENEAYRIERTAHRLIENKKVSGEWFEVSADEAINAIKDAAETVRKQVQQDAIASEEEYQSSNIYEINPNSSDYKTAKIVVMLTNEQKILLRSTAAKERLGLSAWLRMLGLREAAKQSKTPQQATQE